MTPMEHQILFLLGIVILLNFLALRGLWKDILAELQYQWRLLMLKAVRAIRRARKGIREAIRYYLASFFWRTGKVLLRCGHWFKKLADKIDPLPL